MSETPKEYKEQPKEKSSQPVKSEKTPSEKIDENIRRAQEKAKETLNKEKYFQLFCELAKRYISEAAKNHPDKAAIEDRINDLIKKGSTGQAMPELGYSIVEAYEYKHPALKKQKVGTEAIIHGAWYDFYKFLDGISNEYGDKEDYKKFKNAIREFVQPEHYKQMMTQLKKVIKA